MPGKSLESPTPLARKRTPPVPGRVVVLTFLAIGFTLVFGVGTFALLTRPPKRPPSLTGVPSAAVSPMPSGWF